MYAFSLAAQVVIVTSIRQIFLILDHFFYKCTNYQSTSNGNVMVSRGFAECEIVACEVGMLDFSFKQIAKMVALP